MEDKNRVDGKMNELTRLKYFPREQRVELLEAIAHDYKRQIIANQIANRLYDKALRSDALLKETDPKHPQLLKHYQITQMDKQIADNNQAIDGAYESLRVIADFEIDLISDENRDEDNKKVKKVKKK